LTPARRHRPAGGTRRNVDRQRFRVVVCRWVDEAARAASTPSEVRHAYADLYVRLRELGCEVAGYRLAGPGDWPRFCVAKLPHGDRLIMAFRTADEIVLVDLEPHTNRVDPYQWLETVLALDERCWPRRRKRQPSRLLLGRQTATRGRPATRRALGPARRLANRTSSGVAGERLPATVMTSRFKHARFTDPTLGLARAR
jgi:hypothetical protein